MSLLFFDGCGEIYDTAGVHHFWDEKDGGVDVDASGGRRGGAAFNLDNFTNDVRKGFPGAETIVVGFAWKTANLVNNRNILGIQGHGVNHVTLQMTSTGAIRITRSGSTEIGISAGGLVSTATWYYIEFKVKISNTVGTIEVRLDGDTIINETALDTLGSGVAEAQGISFNGNGTTNATWIDDVYVLDVSGGAPYNDFLGDSRVDAVMPDGDGFSSGFDTTFPASPTNHFSKVDEIPPDDETTYNETNTANDIDLFDYAAMPTITGGATVWAVQLSIFLKKLDAGPASFRAVTRPTSTTFNGTTQFPPTDYVYAHELYVTNPQTAAEWTESEVDAAEFGVEVL